MMSLALNVPCQNTVRHFVLLLFTFLINIKIRLATGEGLTGYRGRLEKKGPPEGDPSAVIICHATYVRQCLTMCQAWHEHTVVLWTGWNVLTLQQQSQSALAIRLPYVRLHCA